VKTDFSSLTGSFIAKNGVINNQDLLVKSPLLRIDGAGKINLPKEGINYGLKVSIVESANGQGGKDLTDLKGLTIPVKITGSFDNPKPTVDLASLFKNKAKEEVKAKIADKLKGKLGDDLGGLLGGVLGTDKPKPVTPETTDGKATEEAKPEEPAKSVEDQAKDALKDKLKGFF
jgi:AsmA protein